LTAKNRLARIYGLSAVFLASFLVTPGWLEIHVPVLCLTRRLGFFCPACGLTRAFCALSHGHWTQACDYNPLSPPIYAALLFYGLKLIWDHCLYTRVAQM